jgi:hypothetical protein
MSSPPFTGSPASIELQGTIIPGAEDRQSKIPGFDQGKYSQSRVLCIGAGGLMSNIAPALVRKGIGALTVLDGDVVEVSNLNRQRFYPPDIGMHPRHPAGWSCRVSGNGNLRRYGFGV